MLVGLHSRTVRVLFLSLCSLMLIGFLSFSFRPSNAYPLNVFNEPST